MSPQMYYNYSSSNSAEGEFSEAILNGFGTLWLKNDLRVTGMFQYGKLIRKVMNGRTKMIIKVVDPK